LWQAILYFRGVQLLFRPQSLYLFLAALCAGLMFVFPINSYEVLNSESGGQYSLEVMGFLNESGKEIVDVKPLLPFYVVVPLLSVILAISIFMFNKRKRQMRVSRSSYLITALIIAGSYLANNSFIAYMDPPGVKASFGVSFYLPFAVLAFTWLANRSIKKDEDLIRSLDRLR